jgi:hypothetical protein
MDALPQLLAGAGSGLAGGLLSGLFGIGGGIVLVPLLGLALGLDQHRAQGLTLAAMLLPNSLPAVLHYRRRGVPIRWSLVAWMWAGFLPGIVAGSWSANLIPALPLRWGFAGFLVLLALRTALAKPALAGPSAVSLGRVPLPAFVIGMAGGVSAGLLGIGGGVVLIPLLAWRFRLPQQEAQLQSLVLLLPPLGLPAVLIYAQAQGGLPWPLLGGVAAGFLCGAHLGAKAGTSLSGAVLQRAFAGLILLAALLLVWKG